MHFHKEFDEYEQHNKKYSCSKPHLIEHKPLSSYNILFFILNKYISKPSLKKEKMSLKYDYPPLDGGLKHQNIN